MLSRDAIKKAAGEYDVEVVQSLSLDGASLRGIGTALADCRLLVNLRLSGNQLARIEGLEHLPKLQRLDLSHNRIKRIGTTFVSSLLHVCPSHLAATPPTSPNVNRSS